MAKVQQVKDLFLKATRLSDVAALFRLLDEDFALHLEDGKLEIELSESQYFECFVYDEPSQVEKRAKETIFGRFCVLGISSDGERWIFAKRGIEGRVRILKYSIAKKNVREAENPVSMQRLSALRAGNQSSFTELFERKDISRKFYQEYAKKRLQLVRRIKGMDDVDKKRLYAQVLLDRIIFLYFLQKKSLLDQDDRYLQHRLIAHGKSRESFYRKFLRPLFFDTLCVKSEYRSEEIRKLTGLKLPYLNGGLFLMHDLEDEFPDIDVDDKAFQEIFGFLEGWIWYTNERSQSDDDAIDPYILGYIFEKSLGENKSQGVYYTPPFLSEFLARETIQSHLLEFANRHAASGPYQTLAEFLSKAESHALIAFYYEK